MEFTLDDLNNKYKEFCDKYDGVMNSLASLKDQEPGLVELTCTEFFKSNCLANTMFNVIKTKLTIESEEATRIAVTCDSVCEPKVYLEPEVV